MDLLDIIPEEKILLVDPEEKHKLEVLHELLDRCLEGQDQSDKGKASIWSALRDREINMSTGIGQGVAIPHCSSEHINDVKGMMAILSKGVDFESVDDEPVRIVILLLLPRNRFEKHIKTLAQVARLFNDPEFRTRILESESPAQVASIIRKAQDEIS